MAERNTATIGFEKQIWDAACVLRGNMDASEYKNVVLGLIFLKYISDRFDDKYQELVEEGDGFEEDIDEYTSEGIFFVPANARWSEIATKAHTPEIGAVIDDAMRAIEKENKRLKDILPKNFARPELDKRRLGDVVDLFTNIQMIEHGSEKDILGRTYEYCLSMFAEQEGKRGGEFFTPSCVVRTLVEVLKPFKGRVYDPCCGSGGMFVQSAKFVENHSGNISNISIYGQDSNPTTWKMAQMNLAIRGIEPDLGAYAADTFLDDRHPTLRADYIMANPPFNLSDWGLDKLKEDQRWKYGIPPAGNANFTIENYTIEHIMPQNKNLSLEWQTNLGPEWQEVQKKYLHTIGNLTLTAYNSEMSDRPFLDKMDMLGGFKESALRINKYVVLQNEWNETHIQERANELAKKAEVIWPYPALTATELAPYQAEEKTVQKYSLESYVVNAFTRMLFESLDKRIMKLSPRVKKEYKKLYVAYKLDTNFVDIVFQKQRLRISINMKFSELNDPNGICKDISGLGRWGNGDVELFMEHQDELDQIMEIVKQSYDAQAEGGIDCGLAINIL